MPFMKERVAATYAKEILRVVSGSELAENAVVDGTQVPLNGDGRRILETGTVMVYIGAPGTSKVRPIPAAAVAAGQDEIQTVTLSGVPATGVWTIEVPGYGTTDEMAVYTAAGVQAAIRAIHANLATVTVALDVGATVYTITFPDQDVAPVVVDTSPDDDNPLETAGAAAVNAVVATTQQGVVEAADIAGILMHTTEFWPDATEANKDDAPVALFTKNCHFNAANLTGFSGNAAAVKAAMTGAGNNRCANCTFE